MPPFSQNNEYIGYRANILLVDDEDDSLLAIESVVNDLNANIMMARSGEEALRLVLAYEFAVILLDVKMPDMDGFEIAEFIRRNRLSKKTPIIFITAYAKEEIMVMRGYTMGAVDYIFKPFIPYILHSKVSVFIDLFEMSQQIKEQKKLLEQQSQLELQKRSRELEAMNIKLAASNQELEQFASIASHDLREPLRAITNFIQLLEGKLQPTLDEDSRKYIFFISDGAERMKNLVQAILEISQVARNEMILEKVSVADIVNRVKMNLQSELQHTQGTISLLNNCEVMVSSVFFQQLMQNLIGNALKFRGERKPEIVVSVDEQPYYWLFSVQDNGIGIRAEHRKLVFQIFQKLHKPSEYPGTGLGLAVCEKIVKKHGGNIWVDSSIENGSTFLFTIPR